MTGAERRAQNLQRRSSGLTGVEPRRCRFSPTSSSRRVNPDLTPIRDLPFGRQAGHASCQPACITLKVRRCRTRRGPPGRRPSRRDGVRRTQRPSGQATMPSVGVAGPSVGPTTPSCQAAGPFVASAVPSARAARPSAGAETPFVGVAVPSVGSVAPSVGSEDAGHRGRCETAETRTPPPRRGPERGRRPLPCRRVSASPSGAA